MKFLTVVAILAVLLLATAVLTEQCLQNNDACQPDGSAGTCCSGFCYKQEGWNIGVCANRRKKRDPACLGGGMPCKSDGSRGNCCSGFCNQQAGAEWGNCS